MLYYPQMIVCIIVFLRAPVSFTTTGKLPECIYLQYIFNILYFICSDTPFYQGNVVSLGLLTQSAFCLPLCVCIVEALWGQ